jgi:hypothetical protein
MLKIDGPRFLASLGVLSFVELDHCSVLELVVPRPPPPGTSASHKTQKNNGKVNPDA